jgi:hypothetical protein
VTPPSADRREAVPAGASLELAGADVSDDIPNGAPTASRSTQPTGSRDPKT